MASLIVAPGSSSTGSSVNSISALCTTTDSSLNKGEKLQAVENGNFNGVHRFEAAAINGTDYFLKPCGNVMSFNEYPDVDHLLGVSVFRPLNDGVDFANRRHGWPNSAIFSKDCIVHSGWDTEFHCVYTHTMTLLFPPKVLHKKSNKQMRIKYAEHFLLTSIQSVKVDDFEANLAAMSRCVCQITAAGAKEEEAGGEEGDLDWEVGDEYTNLMLKGDMAARKLFQVLTAFYPHIEGADKMQCHEILSLCLLGVTLTDIFGVKVRKRFVVRMLSDQDFPVRHHIDMGSGSFIWNHLVTILEKEYDVPNLWGVSAIDSEGESDSEDEEVDDEEKEEAARVMTAEEAAEEEARLKEEEPAPVPVIPIVVSYTLKGAADLPSEKLRSKEEFIVENYSQYIKDAIFDQDVNNVISRTMRLIIGCSIDVVLLSNTTDFDVSTLLKTITISEETTLLLDAPDEYPTIELDEFDEVIGDVCMSEETAELEKIVVAFTIQQPGKSTENYGAIGVSLSHDLNSRLSLGTQQCFGETKLGQRCKNRRRPSGEHTWCHHHVNQGALYKAMAKHGNCGGSEVPEWWGLGGTSAADT